MVRPHSGRGSNLSNYYRKAALFRLYGRGAAELNFSDLSKRTFTAGLNFSDCRCQA